MGGIRNGYMKTDYASSVNRLSNKQSIVNLTITYLNTQSTQLT